MNSTRKRLSEYNRIFKESDEIYREVAKALGLSDTAFWIIYTLRENEEPVTQSDICAYFYQPKQTVNSALKKLEQEGYLRLEALPDRRRSKGISLTTKGEALAKKTADQVLSAEERALSGLTEKEQDEFVRLFHKYTQMLKESMSQVTGK